MKKRASKNGLVVRAIAGSHVVLLCIDLPKARCRGLRGFAIHRTDHTEDEAGWLRGMKRFESTDPGLRPGSTFSTREHPVQDFLWSDYSAKPGHSYTYRVVALGGAVEALESLVEVSVRVVTESPENGDHDVYFNRGAASSQEYVRRFGNRRPGDDGGDADPAWAWLSRGAHEAILDFIRRAKKGHALRVCAYEFRLPTMLEELRAAKKRGADVKILYDAGKQFPRDENRAAVDRARIESLCVERLPQPQAIAHNKFIVLSKGKNPIAVLTGSTNFSPGGVFGQSNVVHVIEDETVARQFWNYWQVLAGNPMGKDLRPQLAQLHPLPAGRPPKGCTTLFSPRDSLDALDFYVRLAAGAEGALMMTFAFGMHAGFQEVYETGTARLRYALLEKLLGPGIKKPDRPAALEKMRALRAAIQNRFAVGSKLALNELDGWVEEQTTGLNTHVQFVHTKYMLIDPVGNDPILVTGSANFSAASTNKNDENMVVIRGNERVADIYLGEFIRLWSHYAFREWASRARRTELGQPWYLDPTDGWWPRHFGSTDLSFRRQYLAG